MHTTSVRQAITPQRLLGRTNAAYLFVALGVKPIGSLRGGWLGTVAGPRSALLIGTVGLLGTSLFLVLSPLRHVRTLRSILPEERTPVPGDPVVRRILLIDALAVLGWRRWRELAERKTLGMIKRGVAAIAAAGHLAEEFVDVFAHVVLASMNEIAQVVALAEDHPTATRAAGNAVDEVLRRLLTPTQ